MDTTGTDVIFFGNETQVAGLNDTLHLQDAQTLFPDGLVSFSTIAFRIWCAAFCLCFHKFAARDESVNDTFAVENDSYTHRLDPRSQRRVRNINNIHVSECNAYAVHVHANCMHNLGSLFRLFIRSSEAPVHSPKLWNYFRGAGRRGWITTSFAIMGTLLVLADTLRHYLVVFVTDEVAIATNRCCQPFIGNQIWVTNRRLANVTFSTVRFSSALPFGAW